MMSPRRNRLTIALCLLALFTAAGYCEKPTETEEPFQTEEPDLTEEPELTEESEPTEDPEPTEWIFEDESDDVMFFNSDQMASTWGQGLDLQAIQFSIDPETGTMSFTAFFPDIEDGDAFVTANPNWGLIVAGDDDPAGTQPWSGLGIFGMGKWHIGCFTYTGEMTCELWIRETGGFVQSGGSFTSSFMDGSWGFTFPAGYPPIGHRIGVAVFDPNYFDTLGIEDNVVANDMILTW